MSFSSGRTRSTSASIQTARQPRTTGPKTCVLSSLARSSYLLLFPDADPYFCSAFSTLQRVYICTAAAQEAGLCEAAELGQFIKSSLAPEQSSIYTASVQFDPVPSASSSNDDLQGFSAGPFRYDVGATGYYCVGTVPVLSEGAQRNTTFVGVVDFENVFIGQLPASDYPKIVVRTSLPSVCRA